MNRVRKIVRTVEKTFKWYDQKKVFLAPLAFLSGFVLDNLSSRRIDLMTDNLQLLTYFLIVGFLIIIYHWSAPGTGPSWLIKNRGWLRAGMQLCLGGLLSSHVYFYFQSSAGIKSVAFLAILFFVVLFNEFLKNRVRDLYLQFMLFFLAGFSFFVFFLPVLTHEMSVRMFLLGGVISLIYTHLILTIVLMVSKTVHKKMFFKTSAGMFAIFAVFNVLYFINWIPPVPMALKHVGIYHRVERPTDGYVYSLSYEEPRDLDRYLRTTDRVFNWAPGDTVFCFAAIFAPTAMNKKILHQWEYNDPQKGWTFVEELGYPMYGGRDGGFRGYSYKTSVLPGEWRVEIVTEDGTVLGSVNFVVIRSNRDTARVFKTINK